MSRVLHWVGNPGEDHHGEEERATIGRYQTPAARSMGRFTRTARERVDELDGLLSDLPDLSEIPHRVQRQLAQLCRRYDGHALRRFPADKRHSLLVCLLVDRRQSLLDDLVHL